MRTYLMLLLDALPLCLAKCLSIDREKRPPYRFSLLFALL
jgi:hypothetical protein